MLEKLSNNKREKKENKFEIISYVLILLLFLFIGDDNRVLVLSISSVAKNIIIFILVCLLFLVSMIFLKKPRKFPIISILSFILLMIFSVILLLSSNINNNWYGWVGNVTSILLCALSVIMFSRISDNSTKIILDKVNIIFIIIVFIQVVITSNLLMGSYNFTSQLYKMEFAIPLGASNSIAVFATPIFVSIMLKKQKTKIDYITMILIIAILILTANRSGFFTILLIGGIYWKRIVNRVSIQRGKLIIFLIISGIFLVINYQKVSQWLSLFLLSRIDGNRLLSLDTFSSGRIDIFADKLNKISLRPLLGYGAGFENMYSDLTRAHNWILEVIERSGIIGFLIYIVAICLPIILINIQKNKSETLIRLSSILLSILIISLFEPGLLSPRTDLIFGVTLGMATSLTSQRKVS